MGKLGQGPKTTTTNQSTGTSSSNQNGGQAVNTSGSSMQNTAGQTAMTGGGTSQGAQTGQSAGQQTGFTTPNAPDWYKTFLSQIPGQYQQLAGQLNAGINKPLYGAQQQAGFQDALAHQQGAAQHDIASQLASQGALNSGRSAQVQTAEAQQGQGALQKYLSAVPQLNAQNQQGLMGQLQNLIGQQQGFTSPISAYGAQTGGQQTGTTAGQQAGSTTQQGQTTNQQATTGQTQGTSLTDIWNAITGQSSSNSTGTQQTTTNPWSAILNDIISGVSGAAVGGL